MGVLARMMINYYRFPVASRWRCIPFWDPLIGCTAVGPGCANCSSAHTVARNDMAPDVLRGTSFNGSITFNTKAMDDPLGYPPDEHVFVCGRSDLFHEDVHSEYRQQIIKASEERPDCMFVVLTKRPHMLEGMEFPLNWVVGVSIENQQTADTRLPWLEKCTASVKFVSAKPLLGKVDLPFQYFDGVCVGGEHGPRSRPAHPAWVRHIRNQAFLAKKAFSFHNWGSWVPGPNMTRGTTPYDRTIWVDDMGRVHPEYREGWEPMHLGQENESATQLDGQTWAECENLAVDVQRFLSEARQPAST